MKRVEACDWAIALILLAQSSAADTAWRTLQHSVLHVVRVDPSVAKVVLASATAYDSHARTAKAWCSQANLAMHVEGGPEASLLIHTGGVDLDLCGSYETGFKEDDSNARQWAIPNVLGVAR